MNYNRGAFETPELLGPYLNCAVLDELPPILSVFCG